MTRYLLSACLLIVMHTLSTTTLAEGAGDTVRQLQAQWAKVNYELEGDAQEAAFDALLQQADEAQAQFPDHADVLIWSGIIRSSYAGFAGGLGALKHVRHSKEALEKSLAIDSGALQGSAYTSLGVLYYQVPGWPISFGDDDKARELLQKALSINPEGIDPNYFYADFLEREGEHERALHYLSKALQAAPRPGRELADSGRRQEIERLMAQVKAEIE